MAARRASLLIAGTTLAALLTGCTAGQVGANLEEASPLEKVWEQIWGLDMTPEDRQRQMDQQAAETDQFVATCMQEQGFDYVPRSGGAYVVSSPEDWRPGERSWVAQYGYGIVNVPGSGGDAYLEEAVDPNTAYVASLGAAEQDAYFEALFGSLMVDPGDMQSDDAGCYGWAQRQAGVASFDLWSTAEWQDFFEKTGDLNRQIDEHEKVREVHDDWSSCMADDGFSFAKPADASTPIYDALDEYNATHGSPAAGDPARAEIAELEVRIALADLDCRESTDFDDRIRPIRYELEAKFVAEHQDEIDAILLLVAE